MERAEDEDALLVASDDTGLVAAIMTDTLGVM